MNKKGLWLFAVLLLVVVLLDIYLDAQESEDTRLLQMWKKLLRKFKLPKNFVKIYLRFSFPPDELESKDIYLARPTSIDTDSFGNLYILDKKLFQVLKFDTHGNFLTRIGSYGQGPGELNNPSKVMIIKEFIIVNDLGNRRIQFFDLNGEFIKSIKLFKAYSELVVSENGLIFAAPVRVEKQAHLVDVLDNEGKLLFSFGEAIQFKNNWQLLNYIKLACHADKWIFMGFTFLPIVRKYSQDGRFIEEFQIPHSYMQFLKKLNLKRDRNRESHAANNIQAIRSSGKHFFVLHSYPRLEILEFDDKGNFKNDYMNEEWENTLANDFVVREIENQKEFFILGLKSQRQKIGYFTANSSNFKGGIK